MRKLKITFEEPRDPKNHPRTNPYCTVYGWLDCWALYVADSRKPEIRVVRQDNFLRTTYLLLHELGHWILDCIFIKQESKFKWNAFYDKLDKIIINWK